MLPVMKRLYGHETGLDVDDPDGYGYGVSTYHFNMYIAGLVAEIDKSFSYVPYIGFSRTSREIREKLHNWLKRTECGDKPGTDIKESKKSKPDEEQSKRKDMFEDDSSEEDSHKNKKSKAVDSSDEELGSPK